VFAVPGSLATPTGGYAYDRRVIAELRQLGWDVEVFDLGEGFPRPHGETLKRAEEMLAAIQEGYPIVIDGLAYGVMPGAAEAMRATHPLIALVHHPLALESGLAAAETDGFRHSERAALAAAHRVIVTSAATARILVDDYDVPSDSITVATPGTDATPQATGSNDGIVRLLAVGAIVPRKGYDVLLRALAELCDLPWRLTIIGARDRDPATVKQLENDIARLGLTRRIVVMDAVTDERLTALYMASDIFVLASRYEGYGMAYAEAVAHGLPIVGTTAGAIPDTVPADAGVLTSPDDAAALADALRRLIGDPQERIRLAAGARRAARHLPTWRATAENFARTIEALQ
jgi:glycosyltransferase involved in cell wall biosynthesis